HPLTRLTFTSRVALSRYCCGVPASVPDIATSRRQGNSALWRTGEDPVGSAHVGRNSATRGQRLEQQQGPRAPCQVRRPPALRTDTTVPKDRTERIRAG